MRAFSLKYTKLRKISGTHFLCPRIELWERIPQRGSRDLSKQRRQIHLQRIKQKSLWVKRWQVKCILNICNLLSRFLQNNTIIMWICVLLSSPSRKTSGAWLLSSVYWKNTWFWRSPMTFLSLLLLLLLLF